MDGIRRVLDGSWWERDNGSTLFFWRWPEGIRKKAARDGLTIFVQGKLPRYTRAQQVTSNPVKFEQVWKKIIKVINRGYIVDHHIQSLINYFDVPKGLTDIRLVYDGTKSLLRNEAVWSPGFFLCSVDSALMFVNASTWYADWDLGKKFLNYPMDKALWPFRMVYLSQLKLDDLLWIWMAWSRIFMGSILLPM